MEMRKCPQPAPAAIAYRVGSYWTPERVEWLQANFQRVSWAELRAQFPEKTRMAIQQKAYFIGLHRIGTEWRVETHRLWSQELDDQLRALADSYITAAEIGTRIGRTRKAVARRFNFLGLQRPNDMHVIGHDLDLEPEMREVVALTKKLKAKINEHRNNC